MLAPSLIKFLKWVGQVKRVKEEEKGGKEAFFPRQFLPRFEWGSTQNDIRLVCLSALLMFDVSIQKRERDYKRGWSHYHYDKLLLRLKDCNGSSFSESEKKEREECCFLPLSFTHSLAIFPISQIPPFFSAHVIWWWLISNKKCFFPSLSLPWNIINPLFRHGILGTYRMIML